ncbi:hypothetical protein [Candidatus Harpocratesius sp.]
MNRSAYFGVYFPEDYQDIIIDGFTRFREPINEIFRNYRIAKRINHNLEHIQQLILIAIVHKLFAMNRGQILTVILSNYAPKLKEYLLKYNSTLYCRSWSSPRLKDIVETMKDEFDNLMDKFIDYFYVTIGENACKYYKTASKERISNFP